MQGGEEATLWQSPATGHQAPLTLHPPGCQIQLLGRGAGCTTGEQNKANSTGTSINLTTSL